MELPANRQPTFQQNGHTFPGMSWRPCECVCEYKRCYIPIRGAQETGNPLAEFPVLFGSLPVILECKNFPDQPNAESFPEAHKSRCKLFPVIGKLQIFWTTDPRPGSRFSRLECDRNTSRTENSVKDKLQEHKHINFPWFSFVPLLWIYISSISMHFIHEFSAQIYDRHKIR